MVNKKSSRVSDIRMESKIKSIEISSDYTMVIMNYDHPYSTTFRIKDLFDSEEEKSINKKHKWIKEVYFIMKKWVQENHPELII